MTETDLITLIIIVVIAVMILGAGFYSYFAGKKVHQDEQLRFDAHVDLHAQNGETATFHYDQLPTVGHGVYVCQICDLCGERFFETLIDPPHTYPF